MAEKFKEKIAIVTGGTGAVGKAVAEAFYSEGAKVVATYLRDQDLKSFPSGLRQDKNRVLLLKADLTREEEVKAVFDRTTEDFGTVDYLLNIAGGYMPKTEIKELELQDWDHMMNMNLKSAYLCSRFALNIMLGKGSGRIVSVSAMAGLSPSAGRGAYAISKSGVAILTQIIADEVRGTGVTANAIAPSIIATEANMKSSPQEDYSKWVHPKEIVQLMLYLCSEAAKSINGAVIKIYGGV